MISMMKKVHNLKLTLTAICRHMLSFGIISGHEPVRWQYQITISGWKIREAEQFISKEVNGGRRRRLDRCVLCTKLLDDSCSFQDEEDVVNIAWTRERYTLLLFDGAMNCFHAREWVPRLNVLNYDVFEEVCLDRPM